MIRLFPANATTFTTAGLGAIPDAISCTVTEERNGVFELVMVYPKTGLRYADITEQRIIVCKPNPYAQPQAFVIYKIVKGLSEAVEVYAEHISYRLTKIPVSPFNAASLALALQGLKNNAEEDCPFTFSTDKSVATGYTQTVPASIRQRLGGEAGSILDLYGGEFEWDNFTVRLWNNRGSNRGVTIRYGKNLIDLTQEQNIESTYTGIYPYWRGTDNEQNDVLVVLPEKVLYAQNAGDYAYHMTVPLDLSMEFDEQPTVAQLRSKAQTYITANNIGVPKVSLKVSFIDLRTTTEYANVAPLEQVMLCDTVTVQFEELSASATAKVIKTVYNALTDNYDSVELGDARANLASTIVAQDERIQEQISSATASTITHFERALEDATELIRGGYGGYVVMQANAETGYPEEITIMDTPDIATAVNCIRINKNGIAFSKTGYNGTFTSAWTIDGRFLAQNIDVIDLDATTITTGILTDRLGQNSWDLDTGELNLNVSGAVQSITTYYAESWTNTAPPWEDLSGALFDSNGQELYDSNNERLIARRIWTTTVPTTASAAYRWMRNYIIYKDGTTELTSAVPLQDYYGRANLVMKMSTDSNGNPIGIMSGEADYMRFDAGQLQINSPQFTLDRDGNASFAGAVTATSLTLGGGVDIGVDKITGFDDAATAVIEGMVTAGYVNALGITAASVDAENIKGTKISGKTFVGGRIQDATNQNYWDLDTGEIKITSFANQFSDIGGIAQDAKDAVDGLKIGIAVDDNGVTVGREEASIKGVFSNDSLQFQTLSGDAVAWLSSDAAEGLGVDLIQIGSHTTTSQRWIIKTDQNGDRLTFTRRIS